MKNEKKYFEGFEDKVKAMSAKEIILALVDGMKNPVMKVNIDTYGEIGDDGICYGCCATNFICKVADVDPKNVLLYFRDMVGTGLGHHGDFLDMFEYAINNLRQGMFYIYNRMAKDYGFAQIKNFKNEIPYFTNDNYSDPELHEIWIELANLQD